MSPGRGGWEKGGKKTERKSGELKEAMSPVSRSTQSQSSRAEHVMASLVKTERVKRRDRKMWCSTFAKEFVIHGKEQALNPSSRKMRMGEQISHQHKGRVITVNTRTGMRGKEKPEAKQ